jgi:CubicO group peptidase (beta-lactamase class C family)
MKFKLRAMLSVLIVLLAVSLSFAQEKPQAEPFEGFSAFVEQIMKEWEVPGIAVAIVKDGEVVFIRGYGYRDLETKLPVTPQTLFAIGSTTKAFTAFALGILADEGKIAWDKPVRTWLPEFQLKDEYASEHMTPTDLLNHDSGLPRHDLMWYDSDFSRKEIYDRLRYLEPTAELRQTYQYSNLMFMVAGYLVGQVSGGTWEDFVAERIFKPVGMERSIFGPPQDANVDCSSPYVKQQGKLTKVDHYNKWAVGPAGSIYSSAEDMSKWLLVHLNKGKIGETALVTESTFNLLHTPKTVMGGGSAEMPIVAYGFGWVIQPYRGHQFIWHNGGIDGFYAFIGYLPYDNLGLVVLTNNANNPTPEIISRTLFDRTFGLEPIDWNAKFTEQRKKGEEAEKEAGKASGRKEGTTPSHPLTDYVGTYEHPAYGRVVIGLVDGKLEIALLGEKLTLDHFHYDVFQMKHISGTELMWKFNTDLSGDISSIESVLQVGVAPIVFTRVAEESLKQEAYLQKFVGEYELMGQTIRFEVRGGVLFAIVPGQPDYELVPVKENNFKLKIAEGYSVEFKVDEAGNVTEAVFHQPNGDFPVKRIK